LSMSPCLLPPLEVDPWLRVFSAIVAPVPMLPELGPPAEMPAGVPVPPDALSEPARPAAVRAAEVESVARVPVPAVVDSPVR
jgi:hypothetical protein